MPTQGRGFKMAPQTVAAALLFLCAVAVLGAEPAKVVQASGSVLRTKGKIQTGSSSKIELELPYLAVVRIGSNATFKFSADGRAMALDSGTMLFAQPKAAGTATIRAGGIVTQLSGRAALQLANVGGQVKVIVLDGKVVAQLAAKPSEGAKLRFGQMVAVPAGATSMPPATAFKLGALLKSSGLFNMGDFPGKAAIERNSTKQAPPRPFVTGGFDPDWAGGGGTAALTTLGPAGTAMMANQIEANVQGQRAAEQAAAQLAAEQAAAQQAAAQQAAQQRAAMQRLAEQQAAENAARIESARQLAAQQQAAQQAAQQQAAQQQQGNQGGGNQGQGNQGQGNQGQGNQGGGNQGQGNQGQGNQGGGNQGQGNQGQGNQGGGNQGQGNQGGGNQGQP